MAFTESIIAHFRRLENALNQALARLQDTTDTEALHDVRINLRRIRILLRPLRGTPGVAQLDNAAASLKEAQNALGDWHDRFVWCRQAENQQDLWPLLPEWQDAQETALERAEAALFALSRALTSKTRDASRS
ncbi:hypothetical protein ADP72_11510 [Serratia plymuthica]|nr:CHAD domain-containing protein [Serratia plymuthica]ANJ93568.1 hypothetical protein ADP72_11510 [Serratia plymuthica]